MGASSSAVAHHTGPRDVTSPEYFPEVYPEQAALYRLRKRQAEAGNNENHAENAIEFDEEDEEMAQMAANLGLPRKNPKGQIISTSLLSSLPIILVHYFTSRLGEEVNRLCHLHRLDLLLMFVDLCNEFAILWHGA